MIRYGILKTACLLAATFLVTACTDDVADGTALPPGKYPMTFATAMEGPTQTGATTDNTWAGNERIAVKVGDEVKEYKPASNNSSTLTAVDAAHPFYWQTANEKKEVSAWYCGDGSTAAGQANATRLPTKWTVKTDQSSEGYAKSDLLYAKPQNIAYKDRDNDFIFRHLPAKVVINLKCGNGLTAEDIQNATVRILNQAITSGTIDATAGTVEQTTPSSETIIPNVLATPPEGYQKSMQAIVVPQQVAVGTRFIKVTIGEGDAARDYYYAPKTDNDVNLEYSKQYTYNITVTKGEELVVTNTEPVTWSDIPLDNPLDWTSSTKVFRVKIPQESTISDLVVEGAKVFTLSGDYAILDGKKSFSLTYSVPSDGSMNGFVVKSGSCDVKRKTEADGKYTFTYSNITSDLELAYGSYLQVGDFYCRNNENMGYWIPGDVAPTADQQADCIGIVYSTDIDRIGDRAKEALKDKGVAYPHGLVMALTNASETGRWGNNIIDENGNTGGTDPFQNNTNTTQKVYDNVDGYGETQWIINTYKNDDNTLKNTYSAFYHASRYGIDNETSQYATPANTTGWFIPSMGQWWDILSNLGGIDLNRYRNRDPIVIGDDTGTKAVNNMNRYLMNISGAAKFSNDTVFWSSSEYSSDRAFYVGFRSYGTLSLNYNNKYYSYYKVRCIFAF